MSRTLEELAEKLTGEIEQHLVLAEALGELSYRERRPEIIGDHVLAALREAVAQERAALRKWLASDDWGGFSLKTDLLAWLDSRDKP